MQKITLFNKNIMVKEIVRENDNESFEGLIIPKESMEDEQVSQGIVVRTNSENIAIGDVLMFHRVMPVDINMRLEDDKEMSTYFFIKESDIICKIEN